MDLFISLTGSSVEYSFKPAMVFTGWLEKGDCFEIPTAEFANVFFGRPP